MASKNRPRIEIRQNDLDILRALFDCRVMSQRQITDLHFAGNYENAKKRLQKLKRHGYIRQRQREIGDPAYLHLSTKAFEALRESGMLASFPYLTTAAMEKRAQVSEATLKHELAVGDVRAAFLKAVAERPELSIVEFSTWPRLFQFTATYDSRRDGRKEVTLKPDGFIRIREEENGEFFEHMFFLEIDRSSESQEIIAQKAYCYLDFYQTGGMAVRFGKTREDYRDFPFRVLMVFQNEERRNNAAERLLRNTPPILTQVWLTTVEELCKTPLGQIWIHPKEYATAIQGTKFDLDSTNVPTFYARQTERERLVRTTIQKHNFLKNR